MRLLAGLACLTIVFSACTIPAQAWRPTTTAQRVGPVRPKANPRSHAGAYNAKKLATIQRKATRELIRNLEENMQLRADYQAQLQAQGYASPGVYVPLGCLQVCPTPQPSPSPIP